MTTYRDIQQSLVDDDDASYMEHASFVIRELRAEVSYSLVGGILPLTTEIDSLRLVNLLHASMVTRLEIHFANNAVGRNFDKYEEKYEDCTVVLSEWVANWYINNQEHSDADVEHEMETFVSNSSPRKDKISS